MFNYIIENVLIWTWILVTLVEYNYSREKIFFYFVLINDKERGLEENTESKIYLSQRP